MSETQLRARRTRAVSANRAEEITKKEKQERNDQPGHPCHVPQDSLLSSSSGYTNYRGVLNLCIVLLALSNARVALENIIKYGILVDPVQVMKLFFMNPSNWPSVLICLSLNVFLFLSLRLEIALCDGMISEKTGRVLNIFNLFTVLACPPLIVYFLDCHPGQSKLEDLGFSTFSNPFSISFLVGAILLLICTMGSSIALGFVSITFLKLVSYHMVNFWCRERRNKTLRCGRQRHSSAESKKTEVVNGIQPETPLVCYPENLNYTDLYYFMFAPTLCYELNFPRSSRVRKRFLIKRIIEMVFLLQLILGLVQQWMVPAINNSLKPLKEMDLSRMLERLLKLSIPNHFIWLIFFYWFFHSCLNTFAEVFKFADRQFYRDWWNAETVNYFWANWNIPVHKWAVRHLYQPLMSYGVSRRMASAAVFCVSAFFHEYLVSVPLKMFRIWAFSGMVLQVPFAMFVKRFLNKQYGNMAVWLSLIIGQPLCILMYYHDYYVIHVVSIPEGYDGHT